MKMNVNIQSSKALDRTLANWFQKIDHGELKLPRFQRFQAWDKKRIASLLETIIYNLPLGVTLVLEVGEREKFESRYLETAPESHSKPVEHLLDGQQRLTALWRTMHNNYESETYFIYIPEFDQDEGDNIFSDQMIAYCQGRWYKRNKKYPLWADDPKTCFHKGLIPVSLLRPMDIKQEIDEWINAAVSHLMPDEENEKFASLYQDYFKVKNNLDKKIIELRERVTHYNLPYLALPGSTPKDVALRVFINMNTNTKPLSLYDVIVAEVENVKGVSLHNMLSDLDDKHPRIKDYFPLEQLTLTTSALIQDKTPNNAGMLDMSKSVVVNNWARMVNGLNKMVVFLTNEGIYNRQILPTNAVLAVIAALYDMIPESLDDRGKAEILLRKYLWSAFFTDRYENAAATRAFKDYTMLKHILLADRKEDGRLYNEEDVPVLNRVLHPIADIDELILVGWPRRENIRGRALIGVTSRLGAFDFSDGQKLNEQNLHERDYHHIFPKALLKNAEINADLALNCALITSSTNKSIGAKDPLKYIKEKYRVFDETTIKFRLNSHLIPTQPLKELERMSNSIESSFLVRAYKSFLKTRAGLFIQAAELLCEGKQITVDGVLEVNQEIPPELKELDEEVGKIERSIRKLINDTITSNRTYKNILEVIPQQMLESATSKYESWLRKNPGVPREERLSLKTVLNNLSLSEYQDIIKSKKNWEYFEHLFNSKGNVTTRFSQLATMRNKIRHENELTTVERKDGEAAIDWFNIVLMEYIN